MEKKEARLGIKVNHKVWGEGIIMSKPRSGMDKEFKIVWRVDVLFNRVGKNGLVQLSNPLLPVEISKLEVIG